MPAQTGYFDTLKSVAGKVFACLASITLTGTDGKTITCTQDTELDEAIAMSRKAGLFRVINVYITGVTDANKVTIEVVSSVAGEAIASETIDKTNPTGGTRFDINAAGNLIVLKGMTKTATDLFNVTTFYNETGVYYYGYLPAVATGGKLQLTLYNVSAGALDLCSIANGKQIYCAMFYRTSD
jgi:hypothetical protein